MTDPVTAALHAIDYDAWVTDEHGDRVPQSSSPRTIERMLRLLDLRPGQRVMEIGTGSGYTAALLAHAVGDHGYVVSLDVDPELVERAAKLHQQAGANVEVHAVDGFVGWPDGHLYDRIVGWTTPHLLPRPWVEQAVDDAVLVTPVKLAPIANANAILRCRIVDGAPRDGSLQPGSFIEMAPDVVTDLGTPVRYVDAVLDGLPETPPAWLSAAQLHDQPRAAADQLLRTLDAAELDPGFLDPAEGPAFEAFLLASSDRPASAGTRHGWGMGVATTTSVAIVIDGGVLATGASQARDELAACHQQWLAADQPSCADLVPAFAREHDGWSVRASHIGRK